MSQTPYSTYADYAFWKRSISNLDFKEVDPVVKGDFTISPSDKVVTAGSCFAQHIARYLAREDFNFFVTEPAHPIANTKIAQEYGYGDFSARYGNIYTSRQLLQLFDRAYGSYVPKDNIWTRPDGNFADPFRPRIQPDGFASVAELTRDRAQHFAAVREAFENLDVFIFTLGLTETWYSADDGAVYPLCPGVAAGDFDKTLHKFANFSVDEVTADMNAFIQRLRSVNPEAKIIITVSPVPLIATAEDRHVLVSTTYSKSVLRVAAENICQSNADCAYYPSYEIITGPQTRGRYYAGDSRGIMENGVRHVMGLFMQHYTSKETAIAPPIKADNQSQQHEAMMAEMTHLVEVNCDEEALDPGRKS